MELFLLLLFLLFLFELVFFFLLLRFFKKLKHSEDSLLRLQELNNAFAQKMQKNSELEAELIQSFAHRQKELHALDQKLEERKQLIQDLLDQAEAISRSPQFLRELIFTGHKKGRSPEQLAKGTGLSLDEVNLILAQQNY